MHHDPRGIALTTASAAAARQFDLALTAFLAQRAEFPTLLADTLALDPDMVAAQCLAGFAQLLAARRPMVPQAGHHLQRARIAAIQHGATRREATLIAALAAWHDDGDMWRTIALIDAAHADAPHDLLLLRLSHALRFMLGDAAGMRRAIEAALPAWSPDLPGYGFVLGCHAFALGETGDCARAAAVGQDGVTREPRDLWGAHAVAHALGALRRPRAGIAWITWLAPHMAGGGSFVRHIHWHRALCHLKLGEPEAALSLLDQRIRSEPSGDVRDILNAASLLWRLDAAGIPVRPRWEELADIAQSRTGEHCWAFADLHYVLCLAAAGRTEALATMLASIQARAAAHADTQSLVHRQVGLTAARAVAAAIGGKPALAAQLLEATHTTLHHVGGSFAQRDLFRQMHARATQDAAMVRERPVEALEQL